jgi:hypothetical protein
VNEDIPGKEWFLDGIGILVKKRCAKLKKQVPNSYFFRQMALIHRFLEQLTGFSPNIQPGPYKQQPDPSIWHVAETSSSMCFGCLTSGVSCTGKTVLKDSFDLSYEAVQKCQKFAGRLNYLAGCQ